VSAIRSRGRETINRRTIEQIKPIEFTWCSTGAVGTTISSLPAYTLSGAGSGYNWANSGITIGNLAPAKNAITFTTSGNKEVLIITNDGDVEWHGKPSEAAEALVRTFQFTVENEKGVTKAARRRYYLRACQNILNKAEKMEHDEFVAFLQKQVYNKERRVIMDSLKGEK